jgi:DNA primase
MDADKEEIRARNDIVEVIGSVVQLQKRGRNWVGLCPFHQEKTPSFNVDPVTQTFKCFGCDASGDVFTFIQRHENMSFIEAVEYLARRAGVEVKRHDSTPQQRSKRDAMFEANAVAVTYFRRGLERSPAAREYLAGRKVLSETIEKFQIGFAPDDWEGLVKYFAARKIAPDIATAAGLLHQRRGGGYVDAFRNRIMFPIHDEQMRVVGFGGRSMGDEQPKYLNTGETPIFQKSRLLYALPFARRRIADEGYTLLMEGYMDVVTAHQGGFEHAVASLGTAFTADHARRLARLAPRVMIVYDADSAGVKAALRAAAELEQHSVTARIVRLPAGEDPDSLIRSGHPEILARAITQAITRVEMELDLAIAGADSGTDYGRQALLQRVVEILATVPARSERDAYIEKVWQLHPLSIHGPGVAKEQLHRDAEEAARRRRQPNAAARQPFQRGRPSDAATQPAGSQTAETRADTEVHAPRVQAAEKLILRALASPEHRACALRLVEPEDLADSLDRQIYLFVRERLRDPSADEAELVRRLREEGPEGTSEAAVQRLQESQVALANEPIDEEVLADAVRIIRDRRAEMVNAELMRLLQSKTELTAEDRDRVHELHALLARLKGSRA